MLSPELMRFFGKSLVIQIQFLKQKIGAVELMRGVCLKRLK